MNVLILGGTGNISSAVVAALSEQGHAVSVLTTGRRPVPTGVDVLTGDRTDAASLETAIGERRFDVVIDFLAFTPSDVALAREVVADRATRYVLISSATVYRKPHEVIPLREDGPLGNPYSLYARNKQACEEWLVDAWPNVSWTIIRPSHTFGRSWIPSPLNGSDWTVAARILAGKPILVHDGGRTLWTLTAASDFAQALVQLLESGRGLGEIYHITSDQALTWNAIYFEIGRVLGREPVLVPIPTGFLEQACPVATEKLRGDKSEAGVFDNTKIKRAVPDWECRKSFRSAIEEAVGWYREVPQRQVVNAAQDAMIERILNEWQNSDHS